MMVDFRRILLFATPIPLIIGIWYGIRHNHNFSHANSSRYIRVLAYEGVFSNSVLDSFKQQFHTDVLLDTVVTPSQMEFHLRENPNEYDVLVPYQQQMDILTGQTQLASAQVPLWHNVSSDFMDHQDLTAIRYLPVIWGVEGFLYDQSKFASGAPHSWKDLLQNKKLRKHLALSENPLEIYSSLLRRKVISDQSLNSPNGDQVLAAIRNLLQFADLRAQSPITQLLSGQYWVIQVSSGRAGQLLRDHPNLHFMIPAERSTLWTQSVAIPAHAQNVRGAQQFLNFLLTPQASKMLIAGNQQGTTNQALNGDTSIPEMMKASYVRKLPLSRVEILETQLSDHAPQIEKWLAEAQSKTTQ